MSGNMRILIVEDDQHMAWDLVDAVEALGGEVIGPIATVAEALALIDATSIAAAVLDANLLDRDVSPVAIRLLDRDVPIVIHSGKGLPPELAARYPDVPVIMKPISVEIVVLQLLSQLQCLRQPQLPIPPMQAALGG